MSARIIELATRTQERQGTPRPVRRALPWTVELSAMVLVNHTHYHALRCDLVVDPAVHGFCLTIYGSEGRPDKTLSLVGDPERVLAMSEMLTECFGVPA